MNFNQVLLTIAASAAIAGGAIGQSLTDADERYKIKYGRYPPHVEAQQRQLRAAWREKTEDLFRRIDGNRDGTISKREWRRTKGWLARAHQLADHDDHFYELDLNEDGRLSRTEWREGV